MAKKLPIKHIGIYRALCNGRSEAYLRTDLGVERYRQLGVKERFRDQEPYRVCPACIKVVPNQYEILRLRAKRREQRQAKGPR